MKGRRFWTTLTSLNLIAIVIPYMNLVQADSYASRYLAAITYFSALLFVATIDAVAIRLL